jgi:RNA polymerase sigma-70 factor, ECF subfamily
MSQTSAGPWQRAERARFVNHDRRGPPRSGLSDEELMRRVQRDDTHAFELLYERYRTRAHAVAQLSCGSPDRAQEAVQEAFMSIWTHRGRYHPERGQVAAWAMSIVRNRSVDLVRRNASADRRCDGSASLDEGVPAPGNLEDETVEHDDAKGLRVALHGLPRLQQEVIALAFYGGFTHNQIAARLGLPPGTVKGRMRLGLKALRGPCLTTDQLVASARR